MINVSCHKQQTADPIEGVGDKVDDVRVGGIEDGVVVPVEEDVAHPRRTAISQHSLAMLTDGRKC